MGIELLWGPVVFIGFLAFIGFLIEILMPSYDSNYDSATDISNIPNNIKAKTTTKARWAKRSQQYDDSFGGAAIMWADLGND